jgi:DNA-binding transcriptional LysR family regulator
MLDRYQLRYLLAIVEAGNFSRAAAQLNVTQPTLSAGIAKMEASLGVRLFHRDSHRVHLTPAGARLLPYAQRIENDFQALGRGLSDAPQASLVRLGVLSTLPTSLIEGIAGAWVGLADPPALELTEGREPELLARLARQRIDIALTLAPRQAETRVTDLFEEPYVLALPRGHAFAQHGTVDGADLAGQVMIVRRHCEALSATSRYFTSRGVRPRFSFRGANDDRVVALVRAGLGLTVLPQSLLTPDLAGVALAGFGLTRRIALVVGEQAGERIDPSLIDLICSEATRAVGALGRAGAALPRLA